MLQVSTKNRGRRAARLAADLCMWWLGLCLGQAARYDFSLSAVRPTAGLLFAAGFVAVAQVVLGALGHLYRGRYRYGSFDEVLGVLRTVGSVAVALGVVEALGRPYLLLPRSVPLIAGLIAFTGMLGVRYGYRLLQEHRRRSGSGDAVPLLLFGAGTSADQLLATMLADDRSQWFPVGLLDDDPRKRHLRLRGVAGAAAAATTSPRPRPATGARTLLVAVPTRDARAASARSAGVADAAGVAVQGAAAASASCSAAASASATSATSTRPTCWAAGRSTPTSTRSPATSPASGCWSPGPAARSARSCAASSTGSRPAELIMLDRDESALHAVQLSIDGRALLDSADLVLADIRDAERHRRGLRRSAGPQVVFHAAALKHLPLLEMHPGEAVKTNVWGTLTVLDAAPPAGVERFVNISTDKAADPISVLGYTKRIAERLTAARRRAQPTAPTSACASATCWAAAARCSPPSRRRSPPAGRSPSPTPRSPATS